MERDPVCDMEVDPKTAPKSEYQGRTYYFCSLSCALHFKAAPAAYLGPDDDSGKA